MIAQIPRFSEVYSVTGEFDMVAMVRVARTTNSPTSFPPAEQGPGVTTPRPHIAFRAYSRHDLEAAFSLGQAPITADPKRH